MSESKKMDALIAFVRYYAACPCCGNEVKCADGCTFEQDAPGDNDTMIAARKALRGEK